MAGKNVTCNGHLKYTQRYIYTASYCLMGAMLVTGKRAFINQAGHYALGINSVDSR